MQSTEIGHFAVTIRGVTFELKATLENMAKLADSKRILNLFDMLHSPKVPNNVLIDVSREVLLACCNNKDLDRHLVRIKRGKPFINVHCISANDQVVVAASLLRHGVAGVNRPKSEATKKKGKPMDRFDINKIVADAMIHFGLSRKEALELTMSEFYQLLAAKFPVERKGGDAPELSEHVRIMKALQEGGE